MPYCRSSTVIGDEQYTLEKEMQRANAGNAEAMNLVGGYYIDGEMGLPLDTEEGLKWYHRALEAGSGDGDGMAAYNIGTIYFTGDGVDKDIEKALDYFQKAAELEFVPAFFFMGCILMQRGEIEEAMLNYRKAAMCGDSNVFNLLRHGFEDGFITKDEYAYTLRENQAACNEMKSDAREEWLAT